MNELLIIGIGNSSRADDGLGWKFLDDAASFLKTCDVEYRYQLQPEDAALISSYKTVVFVDATTDDVKDGFSFYPCTSPEPFSFSSHRLSPSAVLWLSRELYNKLPQAFVLAIQGIDWCLQESLSEAGKTNLSNAVVFFKAWMRLP